MNIRKNLKTMMADGDDVESISSKRVVTFLAFICCTIAFFANLFFGYKMDQFIYDTMGYIVIGGLGSVALEKFGKRNSEPTE